MKTKLITLLLLFIPIIAWAEPSPTPAPDKLQSALADMVNKSVQVAGDAKDFLVAQLPDVIRQLLAWKMAENFLYFLASTVALVFFVYWLRKFSKWIISEDEFDMWVLFVFACIPAIVSFVVALNTLKAVLEIWIAPKVYLIEYSKALITGH